MPSRIQNKRQIKNFKYEGVSTDTLFGQHLFPSTGKRIVITEGELDAASCYEAMENWPMVSLPHGAAGAKKDLRNKYLYYKDMRRSSSFSTMTKLEETLQNRLRLSFRLGRLKSHDWKKYKDASDALQANAKMLLDVRSGDAKPYQPGWHR